MKSGKASHSLIRNAYIISAECKIANNNLLEAYDDLISAFREEMKGNIALSDNDRLYIFKQGQMIEARRNFSAKIFSQPQKVIRAKKTSEQNKILAYAVAIWTESDIKAKHHLYLNKAQLHLIIGEYSLSATSYLKAIQLLPYSYLNDVKASICANFLVEAMKIQKIAEVSHKIENYEKVLLVYQELLRIDADNKEAIQAINSVQKVIAEYRRNNNLEEKHQASDLPNPMSMFTSKSDEQLKKDYEQQLLSYYADKKDIDLSKSAPDLVCAGWEAITNGNFEQAVSNFEQAIAVFPHDFISLTHLGVCYTKLKNWDKAEDIFNNVINQYDFTMAYHGLAALHAELGNYSRAHTIYSSIILRKEPYFPINKMQRLAILSGFNDIDRALNVSLLNFLQNENMKNAKVKDFLGRATDAYKQQKYEVVINYLTAALYNIPDDCQLYLERADARLRLKQYKFVLLEVSLAYWATQIKGLALSNHPYAAITANRLVTIAGALSASRQFNDALQLYKAAELIQPLPDAAEKEKNNLIEWLSKPINPDFFQRVYPKYSKYRTLLNEGQNLEAKEEYNLAIEKYNAASMLCPTVTESLLRMVSAYKKMLSQPEQKELLIGKLSNLYNQVLKISPYQAQACRELVLLLKDNSNEAESIKIMQTYEIAKECEEKFENYYFGHLKQFLSKDKQSEMSKASLLHASKGQKALHAKNCEEAFFHFHEALLCFSDDVVSLNGLAVMHLGNKDYELARLYLDRSINLYGHPSAYYGRGMLYFMLLEYEKASFDFRQAIDLDSKLELGLTENEREFTIKAIEHIEGGTVSMRSVIAPEIIAQNKAVMTCENETKSPASKDEADKDEIKRKRNEVAKKRQEEINKRLAKLEMIKHQNHFKKIYRKERNKGKIADNIRRKQEEKLAKLHKAADNVRVNFMQLKSDYQSLVKTVCNETENLLTESQKIFHVVELKFMEQLNLRLKAQAETKKRKQIEERNKALQSIKEKYQQLKLSKDRLLAEAKNETQSFLLTTIGLFNSVAQAINCYDKQTFPTQIVKRLQSLEVPVQLMRIIVDIVNWHIRHYKEANYRVNIELINALRGKAKLLDLLKPEEKNQLIEDCLSNHKAEHGYYLLSCLGVIDAIFPDIACYLKEDSDWLNAEMKNTAKYQKISLPIIYASFVTSINSKATQVMKFSQMSELFYILEKCPTISGHLRAAADRRDKFCSTRNQVANWSR